MKTTRWLLIAALSLGMMGHKATCSGGTVEENLNNIAPLHYVSTAETTDAELGTCAAHRYNEVRYCQLDGVSDDDEDNGSVCQACPGGTFQYLYEVENIGALNQGRFLVTVPQALVLEAGFYDTQEGSVAPSGIIVGAEDTRWIFSSRIRPGERSEGLYLCSNHGPARYVGARSICLGGDVVAGMPAIMPLVPCSAAETDDASDDDDDDGDLVNPDLDDASDDDDDDHHVPRCATIGTFDDQNAEF